MKINKDSLKAKANNISKELNISQNVVYNRFFMMLFYLDYLKLNIIINLF